VSSKKVLPYAVEIGFSAATHELTIAFDWHLIGVVIAAMDENSKAQTKHISSKEMPPLTWPGDLIDKGLLIIPPYVINDVPLLPKQAVRP
jgi:hypothetical protein